jgi:hypothetical protein
MNAPLPAVSVTATLVDIAQALGVTKQAVAQRANREAWPFEEITLRGGKRRLYPLATLPADVLTGGDASPKVVVTVNRGARMKALTTMLARFEEEQEAARARRQQTAEAVLRDLAGGLSAREALTLSAHSEIAQGWQVWFVKAQPLQKIGELGPLRARLQRLGNPGLEGRSRGVSRRSPGARCSAG